MTTLTSNQLADYNMWIERLDGTRVEHPAELKYPNQINTWAEQTVKLAATPEVYITVWKHDKGEVRKKFYSPECWELETFALEMFEDLCKNHDWYYDYSDDHSVWTRGREAASRLKSRYASLAKGPLKASVDAIWQQYSGA